MIKPKKKVRKNIDVTEEAVKKIKIKAAETDTNPKNYIEGIIEKHASKL